MSARRRTRKPPRNPVTRWLAIAGFTTLAVVGGSALLGWTGVLDRLAKPMLLACALLVIAYTVVAIRSGWIATVGHVGQVYHYARDDAPIGYWVLVVLYLAMAAPTAYYMASLMLGVGAG